MLHSVWVVPVWVAVLVPSTFFLTYCLAIWQNHVQAFVPYISDTGSYPPESCIFAQLLNVAAVLIGLVMYFRHRQIAEFYRHSNEQRRPLVLASTIFLWIGYTSAFGVSMVGNFQQTNWFAAHAFGAGLAFGCGLIYCWAQTVFTYKMLPAMKWPWVAHIRLVLAIVSTVCFLAMSGLGFNPFFNITPSRKNYTANCLPGTWKLVFVEPDDEGYMPHIATTICEWIMSIAFMMYFMTYADELRHAIIIPPKLSLTVGQADMTTGDFGHKAAFDQLPLAEKAAGSGKNPSSNVVLIAVKEIGKGPPVPPGALPQ